MIIKIRDGDTKLTIPVPSSILMNALTASIVSNIIKKHSEVEISPHQLNSLFKAYKKAKWHHRGMLLVDVQSDDSLVQITM